MIHRPKIIFKSHLLTLALSLVIAKLSFSQVFTSSSSPDSEFYFTLASFGNDVVTRSPNPAYYWTRLGQIAPSFYLSKLFGPILGFEVYRWILILVIVNCVYFLFLKLSNDKYFALFSALFFTLNTTIMYFIGNTYVTGSVIAALTVNICSNILANLVNSRFKYFLFSLSGISLGWVLMLYPYALYLGLTSTFFLGVYYNFIYKKRRTEFFKSMTLILITFTFSFGFFLILGKLLFPELSWLDTYIYYYQAINPADFGVENYKFLVFDTSYYLVYLTLILCVILFRFKKIYFPLLLTLTFVIPAIIWVYYSEGSNFYFRIFSSFLWPSLLISLIYILMHVYSINFNSVFYGLSLISSSYITLVFFGHLQLDLDIRARYIILFMFISFLVLYIFYSLTKTFGPRKRIILILCVGVFIQLFQNSAPFGPFPKISTSSYAYSYKKSDIKKRYEVGLDIQKWVIRNTSEFDRLMIWTEPNQDLISYAAFQLWGPNSIDNSNLISDYGINSLKQVQPNKVIVYYIEDNALTAYIDSILSINIEFEKLICSNYPNVSKPLNQIKVCLFKVIY
jgi:hypothetical protein